MSAPSNIYNSQGKVCHGEQEFVDHKRGLNISEFILSKEFLVTMAGKFFFYNKQNLLQVRFYSAELSVSPEKFKFIDNVIRKSNEDAVFNFKEHWLKASFQ